MLLDDFCNMCGSSRIWRSEGESSYDGAALCGVVLFLFCYPCGKEQDNGAGVWSSLYGIIN